MTETTTLRRITNPYPPTRPQLRRAFGEGVLAARPSTPPRDYVCTTEEKDQAWLEGFVEARMADV